MRVGVNTLFLIPNEVGGSETYVRHLLPELSRLDADVELVIFTNEENHDSFERFDRVNIPVRAQSRPRRILAEQLSLPKAAKRHSVDLLFSPGYTMPLRAPMPQVVSILDVQFRSVPEGFSPISRLAQGFFVGQAARRANAILTLSEFSSDEIQRHFGVDSAKIFVSHLAPAPEFFDAQPSRADPPFLLTAANTYRHKNIQTLVRAFDALSREIPHRLVIAGQPRDGEPPPHPRAVRFNHVSQAELSGLMHACDLFILPSLYEGFGLPVIEAMAAGARTLVSRAASIPEVGGEAVTYVDEPTDVAAWVEAVRRLLDEPTAERERMVALGKKRAAAFTWESCARHTLDAFHCATNTRPS